MTLELRRLWLEEEVQISQTIASVQNVLLDYGGFLHVLVRQLSDPMLQSLYLKQHISIPTYMNHI